MNDLKKCLSTGKVRETKKSPVPDSDKICCFHVLKTNIPQNSRSFEQIPFEISLLIANSDARFKKS